jgi:6-phosphogluconate dehydrogenase (decarboxylating)
MTIIRITQPTESIEEFADRNSVRLIIFKNRYQQYEASLGDCYLISEDIDPLPNDLGCVRYMSPAITIAKSEEEAIQSLCDSISMSDILINEGNGQYRMVTTTMLTPPIEQETP